MTEYKILCDIGENICFNIGGQSHAVDDSDIEKDNYLNRIYRIQFHKPPPKKRLEQVINAIRKRPEIGLRFYGNYSEDEIDWTQLVGIQDLVIDLWETNNLSAVSSLTGLKRLGISKNVKSKVSLSILAPLTNLELLFTSISKDIETIAKLTNLRAVSFNEIKNDNLDYLSDLNNLRTVWISLGSYHDFGALSEIQNLEKLRIHQVRGFDDETANFVLSKCKSLWALKLENLRHVTKLDFVEQISNLKY